MKLRHIKAAILTLNSGESVHVEQIGKGRFSEAWKNGSYVYVITRERSWGTDHSKRILAELETENPHIPKVELIGELDSDRSDVFRMPLYKPLTAKAKEAWKQFKELAKLREQACNNAFRLGWNQKFNPYNAVQMCEDFACLVEESKAFPEELKEAVRMLADACQERSTWVMEIAKRNLCVDEQGRLILLDCMFDLEVLENQRNEARKRYERRYNY